MIVDMLCELAEGYQWNKKEALEYVEYWQERIELGEMREAIAADDMKSFLAAAENYLKDYGYEGSWVWRKIKSLNASEISFV